MVEKVIQKPSFMRLLRQIFYVPVLHTGWVNEGAKQFLSEKTTEAEKGHRGEICVVIENNLPIATAYRQTPRARAIELFSLERVWDTEENTGVLVYVNVCEHDLEVVADRGINAFVEQATWQTLCDKAIAGIKESREVESIAALIADVGNLLRQFYALADDPSGNEISDRVRHLR